MSLGVLGTEIIGWDWSLWLGLGLLGATGVYGWDWDCREEARGDMGWAAREYGVGYALGAVWVWVGEDGQVWCGGRSVRDD